MPFPLSGNGMFADSGVAPAIAEGTTGNAEAARYTSTCRRQSTKLRLSSGANTVDRVLYRRRLPTSNPRGLLIARGGDDVCPWPREHFPVAWCSRIRRTPADARRQNGNEHASTECLMDAASAPPLTGSNRFSRTAIDCMNVCWRYQQLWIHLSEKEECVRNIT